MIFIAFIFLYQVYYMKQNLKSSKNYKKALNSSELNREEKKSIT